MSECRADYMIVLKHRKCAYYNIQVQTLLQSV